MENLQQDNQNINQKDSQQRNLTKSNQLWEKGERLIPCGTQTASKAPDQFSRGTYPIYLQSGKGSHVFDVDGNEYIDYPCSLGVIILGHSYPAIVEAISKQAAEGINLSLMHPLEVEVAEMLTQEIPGAESIRFMKNGSDVTSGAIRIARSYTKRTKIAFCGYHGWQDWYVITTGKKNGVPQELEKHMHKFEYNNIESLKKIFAENKDEIAAVIMEPVVNDAPQDDFLQQVKDLAHENGALLIFDEMVTGFRFGLGGAQKYFNVTPDLSCFGKCVANGMPLSIIAGKKQYMDECHNIFLSATFGGEAVSLAAAKATLTELREKPVVEHIWKMGKKFQEGFNQIAQELGVNAKAIGYYPRQNVVFQEQSGYTIAELKTLFLQETINNGVLMGNVVLFNYSHSDEDIDKTLQACKIALQKIKQGIDQGNLREMIQGPLAGEVFRKKSSGEMDELPQNNQINDGNQNATQNEMISGKVLVTGGSGFIGKEIIKQLLAKGLEVNVLDLNDCKIEGVNYFSGSVLDKQAINTAMSGCDYVIHMAAILGVSKSAYVPVECLDVNVLGTKNVLEACVNNNVKKILFPSSSEVYGEPTQIPITEETTLQPKSEYGVSKWVSEEYLKAYKKQHGLDFTIVRYFNVYGDAQMHSWVMSKFVNNALLNKPLQVYGDGSQVRAFCHVKDAVKGTVAALLSKNSNGHAINIGNANEKISMRELAEKVSEIVGRKNNCQPQVQHIPLSQSDRSEKREIFKRIPATEKAQQLLGFTASIDINQGIEMMINHKIADLEALRKHVEMAEEYDRKARELR